MKKFIKKVLSFIFPVIALIFVCLLLPATPRASKSLLFANLKKDSLLQNIKQPRIIFVGGSNLSFGLNSQLIKDSLKMNPINTGVHASIGINYMLNNTIKYVKRGDIVVLIPEYSQFLRDYDTGTEELLRSIVDVNFSKVKLLNCGQIYNIIPFLPKYSFSKLKPFEYFNIIENDIYSVNSFNEYGDAYKHWNKKRGKFQSSKLDTNYNPVVMEEIKSFRLKIIEKGAVLFVSYPGFQDISFYKSLSTIKKIESGYIGNNFKVLGTPERYMIPDSMMFNSVYHLSKKGVDYRTELLIEDLKKQNIILKK